MSHSEYQEIGTITQIFRYPVKSMAGESISSSHLGWHGLAGDRRFAFIKDGNLRGFPWLTLRDIPSMITYRPNFVNPDDVIRSPIQVLAPDGRIYDLDSPEFLEHINGLSRHQAKLIHLWGGVFDAMDVSIITTTSHHSLSQLLGHPVDMRRFRSNIVIEVSDQARKYPEEKWLNSQLTLGTHANAPRLRANRKDLRCMAVNLDPDTAQQDANILKTIVKERHNYLGIYGSVDRPGEFKVGDCVLLRSR